MKQWRWGVERVRSRVNLKPVAILVAIGTVLGVAVMMVHHVQVGRTARSLLVRATVAERAGHFGEAAAELARYLALQPADDDVSVRYAWLLDRSAGSPAEIGRVVAAFEWVLARQPGRADVRRRLAERETERGRYAAAQSYLRVLITAMPADAALDALMARCTEAEGDLTSASQWYKRAVTHGSSRPEGRLALAEFLGRRGRVGEALDLCEHSWENCRADDVARATVAVIDASEANAEDLARAARRLDAEASRMSASPRVLTCLAVVREHQRQFDGAERLYRRVLALDDDDIVALNNLAFLMALRGGNDAEPLELIDRAIARIGLRPALLDTRGVARLAIGDAAGAVVDLFEASDAPEPGTVYFHLAQAHLRLGRADRAIGAYRLMKAVSTPADRRLIDREEALRPGRLAELEALESRVRPGLSKSVIP